MPPPIEIQTIQQDDEALLRSGHTGIKTPQTMTKAISNDRPTRMSRTTPVMTLSNSSNPLTAPVPRTGLTSSQKAATRFIVRGNALVTGGGGVLALTAARALLEHGLSRLTLLDLPSTLASSATEIQLLKSDFPLANIHTAAADVSSEEEVNDAFENAVEQMGDIHILCCFAGVTGCTHSINATMSQFRKVVDVNLIGSFLCAQAAARHMIESGRGGSILLTSSISAHVTNFPRPQAAYNISKAGVSHLTKNLAVEWAIHGIRVNCISPGYMDVLLHAGDNFKDIRDIWTSRCPMGRMGDPEEITGPVVMLCSHIAGRYITGTDLVVDGGALCF